MSGKSVAQKLLIKPGSTVWLSDQSRLELLGQLPDGAVVRDSPEGADCWIVFVPDRKTLDSQLQRLAAGLLKVDKLWFAYPKGNRSDINRDSLWPVVAAYGVRPVTQVAIDDVWSGLRFRPLREGEAQFGERKPR